MFVDSVELWIENNKKKFRENCFENVVSDLEKNGLIGLKKYFKKKCDFKFYSFMYFYFFALFFQGNFTD